MALPGAVEVKVMVWLPLATVTFCWTWVAAFQTALPAWLASSLQVPAALKLTTPLVMEHTDELEESTVIVTARVEVAVAVGV